MESKVRVKIKDLEIDFEGSEGFLKEELPNLLKTVSEMFLSFQQSFPAIDNVETIKDETSTSEVGEDPKIEATVKTIAAKLDVKDGPGLIIAAAVHLVIVRQEDKFHRKDLLEAMKSATGYYKPSYSSNLSKYLKVLVKNGDLTEHSTEVYTLTAKKRKELEVRLAE